MAATYPADTFQEGVDLTIEASNQLAQVVRGDANTEVTVADGSTIPSIRKAQTDSMYFKEPELWVTGQTETDYLQLKKYINPTTGKESWWFAKGALVSNPIAMGTSPFGDDNWTLYTPEDLFISGKAEYESVYQALKGKAAEAGYNLVRGSFEEGGTLTNNNDVLWYQANGEYYNWYSGSAKTVVAGSTPSSTGGISPTAWVDRTDVTLRSEINIVWKNFACIADVDGNVELGDKVFVENYHLNGISGGLFFTVVAAGTGTHDGGKYIDLPTSVLQLKQNLKTPYYPEAWGAVGDGVAEDQAAIQSCLDYVSNGKVELRNSYKFTKIYIKNQNVELCGGGALLGTIQCYNPAYTTSNSLDLFFNIHHLVFNTPSGVDSIELAFCRRGWIKDNKFVGGDANIKILNVDGFSGTQPWGQQVSRIEIDGNKYNDPNYFLYSDASTGISFNFADSIISKNEGRALVEHVYIESVDGLNMFDNIFFFKSYNQSDLIKQNSATIKNGAWLSIHDNKFFESGKSGLKLVSCSRYNLHDNLYAFTGQHTESPAIDISGSPIGGAYFSQASIHDENIEHPSGVGISIGAKSGRLKVHSNNIQRPGASTYYYGSTALSGNRYGIVESSDTLGIDVSDNSVSRGTNIVYNGVNGSNSYRANQLDTVGDGSSARIDTRLRTLTVTDTPTSIDVTNYDVVDLNASSAHSVSSIVNNGEKKVVIFRAFNSNTTFTHNASILNLAGSVNYTPIARDTLQLLCESSTFALEIGRAV